MTPPVPISSCVAQLRALGVEPGGVLLVHTSFRAVGPVEGGPDGLIDALLAAVGPEGTVVMPSWSGDDDRPFDPRADPAAPDLGVVADHFWRRAQARRSDHCFAFAAIGPRANEVVATPLPLPPHCPDSPVGRVHDLDGQVLLLGVGHDADTTLHLAELMVGVPYGVPHHCTILEDGIARRITYIENDHCCRRFELADGWLRARHLQREGPVGRGHARLARARDIVRVSLAHLHENPFVFLHPAGGECAECDAAREHGRDGTAEVAGPTGIVSPPGGS